MKVIARHATNESVQLNALLAQEPELRAEFERLKQMPALRRMRCH